MTAASTLVHVKEHGWRMGFANLLRNENREWWGNRRWLKQTAIWLLIVNGFMALTLFILPTVVKVTQDDTAGAMDPVSMGAQVFFQLGPTALAIGTVIQAQGKLIDERQTGIAAWILSKPVARPAYFLSKVAAHSIGMFAIMIGLQGAVAYGLLWLARGDPLTPSPFLAALGGLALHTFFYLTLTLMLGVVAKTRGQVLGVAMGVLFGGILLPNIIGKIGLLTPWLLPNILPALAMEIPLPLTTVLTPILATFAWSITFVIAALWKLSRQEF